MKLHLISKLFFIFCVALLISSCEDEHVHDHGDDHEEAYGIQIKKANTVIFKINNLLVDTTIAKSLMIDKNQSGELSVQFLGEDGKVLTSVEDDVTFAYAITDTSIASLNVINAKNSANDFKINITNKKMGKTTMEIRLDHEGHTDYRTPFFNIETK